MTLLQTHLVMESTVRRMVTQLCKFNLTPFCLHNPSKRPPLQSYPAKKTVLRMLTQFHLHQFHKFYPVQSLLPQQFQLWLQPRNFS